MLSERSSVIELKRNSSTLVESLIAAKNEFKGLAFCNKTETDLHTLIELTEPVLNRYNLAVLAMIDEDFYVITTLIHTTGQSVETIVPIVDNFKTSEELIKCVTEARFVGLCSLLNIPMSSRKVGGVLNV